MLETPSKNPFRPGVGTPPLYLAGRNEAIGRFRALLRAAPELPANMRVTGLRGVGKTVLLNKFAEIAREANWYPIVAELQPGHANETALKGLIAKLLSDSRQRISAAEKIRAAIGQAVKSAGDNLKISWNDVTISYDPSSTGNIDIARDLFDTTHLAVEKGYGGLVLLLDEAQVIKDDSKSSGDHPLSLLLSCVSTLQRSGLPIGLVLCGLPTLTSNLLKARSYTERMFRGEEVSSLTRTAAIEAFERPLNGTGITIEGHLADIVADEVQGYPYFIQFWGAELWDAAVTVNTHTFSPELLAAIREQIYKRLDLDFYQPRVKTLTPAEQDLLISTIACDYPPLIVSDLKSASDKTAKNVNVLLGRLVEAGVIYRLRKGQYEYTAPKFRAYLERHPN